MVPERRSNKLQVPPCMIPAIDFDDETQVRRKQVVDVPTADGHLPAKRHAEPPSAQSLEEGAARRTWERFASGVRARRYAPSVRIGRRWGERAAAHKRLLGPG
jgi:hypothetical protein